MSILSVTAHFYWQVELDRIIPAALFVPPPKVDSQILVLRRRRKPLFDDVDPGEFFRVVKAGFAQPRKTLLNNLTASLQLSQDETRAVCERAAIDSGRRAQTLDMEEWRELYKSIHT